MSKDSSFQADADEKMSKVFTAADEEYGVSHEQRDFALLKKEN